MDKRGLSQEWLKIIACVTMLIDHVGATVVYDMYLNAGAAAQAQMLFKIYLLMRIIGRVSFPIYCFLLAEGVSHTRNPKRYVIRLAVGAVLSEIPFDLALFGAFSWRYQSVMLTLLLGFFALETMKKCPNILLKVLAVIPFALLAEWMNTDYGGMGVVLIAVFALCRDLPRGKLWCLVGTAAVLYLMPSASVQITKYLRLPLELFALVAMIPIHFYSGRKATASKAVQWGFYLFYPVHLALLWIVSNL